MLMGWVGETGHAPPRLRERVHPYDAVVKRLYPGPLY